MSIYRGLPKGFLVSSKEDSYKIHRIVEQIRDILLQEDDLNASITAMIYCLGFTLSGIEFTGRSTLTLDEKLDSVKYQLKNIIEDAIDREHKKNGGKNEH